MSTLDVTCPNCQKAMRVPAEASGKRIRCKACSHVFTAGGDGGAAAPPPVQAAPAKPVTAKPARPKPVVVDDDEPKPAPPPIGFAPDEDDGPKDYKVEKSEFDVPRCPRCAIELEDESTRICLNCGYDMQERRQHRTVKTYKRTAGDVILYWLPAVIWFGVLMGFLGLLIWMCFNLGTFMRQNDILTGEEENPITGEKGFAFNFRPMACDVCCGVFILGLASFGGPVIWRRLKHPMPAEVEKKGK